MMQQFTAAVELQLLPLVFYDAAVHCSCGAAAATAGLLQCSSSLQLWSCSCSRWSSTMQQLTAAVELQLLLLVFYDAAVHCSCGATAAPAGLLGCSSSLQLWSCSCSCMSLRCSSSLQLWSCS